MAAPTAPATIYDVIGLGFGPANVAIAGAIVDKWATSRSGDTTCHAPLQQVLFIEKQPEFRWHPGMLLPNSRMQISFLKDLATLRSPQSSITFLAYLHSQGRLLPFINRGSFTPTRREYADYLSWAADSVQKSGIQVQYGEEVVGVTRLDDGTIEVRSRNVATGEEFRRVTRNLIISPGGTPKLPPALSIHWPHPRIFHSSAYISSADSFFASIPQTSEPLRIAVIGAGQSATEVLLDLQSRLNTLALPAGKKHVLDMIFRKGSLKPSDDSPFSNEIFDPASTDFMFGLPTQRDRQQVLREYDPTNYSVVNINTIESLYEVMYHQKLLDGIKARTGRDESNHTRITLHPHTSIYAADIIPPSLETSATNDAIKLTLHGVLTRAVSQKTYDAVFCGTGYDRDSWTRLLASSNLAEHFGIKSSPIELVAESEAAASMPLFADLEDMESRGSSSSTDGFSTPPTPDTPHSSHSPLAGGSQRSKVRISRTYRLLSDKESKGEAASPLDARVYLQGCTQPTHGLSESLLSILGVRAGLVVDELCNSADTRSRCSL
ncbi:lysine/ornithine N-monooxygenase [Lentinus tigrinus ALCF2SS1-7]|uniref:L-ornithine N(5)-monooxygenase [NAD(P)H] n=1 Tax=Lentinus tigrinus ALCF2SS1-6 TaxID=1328759 RepID=A0A5C2SQM5_9APHY|nr:lysine/ornithine N-monooxygenase [Lentinus tigrinus ALCF2SS1-6]RPD80085.1 lysine/ornithine N-monooxygenase [Lentinus tigrinus ALCF2SS1-7]